MKTLRAYIIARVLLTIPMLLILVTFIFFVVHLMPGDPVEAMIGQNVPQEYKDQIKHNLGLDRPLFLNFRGSRARVKPDTLFLQTKPGAGGRQALRVEGDSVLVVSNRKKEDGSTELTQASDWLQVAVPKNFVGWVSPDQMAWMRRVSMDITVLEERELEGAGTWTGFAAPDGRPWIKVIVPEGGMEGWAPADQFEIEINPFDSQYFNYLWGLVRLDLGESLAPTRGRPVIEDLKLKFPATLELAIASLTVAMLIGVSTGAFAAHKRRSPADYGFRIFSIVIWAVPVFWLGLMFQLILGVYFGDWYQGSAIGRSLLQPIFGTFLPLPISGRIGTELAPRTITSLYLVDSVLTGNWEALKSTIRHLILPALSLGLYLSGVFTRLTRSNMLDVLCEDYITAARARGIKEQSVVYQHALKNAFIPILTMMGLQFAVLLAGAILTETTFSWPGMGLFMWERISYRDFNSIQGSVAFFAVLVAAVSLTVDIIYAWIDPRIRY